MKKTNAIESLRPFLTRSHFPDPTTASEDGLLCFGGELQTEVLLDAYFHGIFPWPHEGYPMLWFCPLERGILVFKDLHIPKSMQKLIRKNIYTFRFNTNFEKVLEQCALVPRKGQKGTWITDEIKKAYLQLFKEGFAISIECYRENTLVGGLYGVLVAGVFSGESMYGLEDNVSKLCVIEMVKYLERLGHEWMDIQMVTPVMELLGGQYLSRVEYLYRLKQTHGIYFSDHGHKP